MRVLDFVSVGFKVFFFFPNKEIFGISSDRNLGDDFADRLVVCKDKAADSVFLF